MKKIIPILIAIIIILGSIAFLIYNSQNKPTPDSSDANKTAQEPEEKTIGGQRDEHGCLGPAGYSWCEDKKKCLREWEEPCQDEDIFSFLQKIKDDTGISLSGIAPVKVFWKVELNDGQIAETMHEGRGMGMSDLSVEDINKIKNYLLSKGYNLNQENTLTNTEVISDGYIMENKICTVIVNNLRQDNRSEFTIDCASANLDTYKNFPVEDLKQSIKTAIVNKRGFGASELIIKVTRLYGDYASGGAMPPVQGVGGGMWIGAKVDNNWELVWDGNGGISCDAINPYSNMPTQLVPECYDETTKEMIIR